VAERLLGRARRIKKEDPLGTEGWIQVAVLAGEAKEILGGLSRTTVYEALALQNVAEVHAELSFHGMAVQVGVQSRLKELEGELSVVQRAGISMRQEAASVACVQPDCPTAQEEQDSHFLHQAAPLNFLVQTVNTLRLQFAEHEQVQAAEDCLYHFAKYQHRLERLRTPWIDPHGYSKLWVLLSYYPSCATRAGTSVGRLAWVSAIWIVIFAVFYTGLFRLYPPKPPKPVEEASPGNAASSADRRLETDSEVEKPPAPGFSLALWHSALTFLLQPSISIVEQNFEAFADLKASFWYQAAVFLELGIAYLHLGLLVSVLYRRITKRAP
jgi:hypothetical protein